MERPAQPQSKLREVAMPSEHGGWGLTIEPGLLGLLVSPNWAGLCIALSAVLGFLARTPIKLALIDRYRGRMLDRTRLAARVGLAEGLIIVALVVSAIVLADTGNWWLPVLGAAPLLAVEGWFDIRSKGRRLIPELAGAVAIASVAAMIALAGDKPTELALGLWAILAARVLTSIPHIRAQIRRLHKRPAEHAASITGDIAALVIAGTAAVVEHQLIVGAAAIATVVMVQRVMERRPPRPPKVLGMFHMVMGFAVVAVTAIGVAAI